jgi:hypothetical protein
MLKKLMITTAAAALMAGSAIAQSPPSKTESPAPKSETQAPKSTQSPSTTQSPSAQSPSTQSPMTQGQGARSGASAQFVTQQTADQWMASKFKGTDVVGNNDEKIGDVSDILFDQNGKVLAYIVGVGGFLGIGSKDVALAPTAFQVMRGDSKNRAGASNDEIKLKLAMSKDDLKNAPEFKPYSSRDNAPTTGQGSRNRAPATPPSQK